MRSKMSLAMMLVCAAAVSSCASKVAIRPEFPPVADMKVDPEPEYPLAALEPGEAGTAAERAWWNQVLLWGRTHHDRVQRICGWARELKAPVPEGPCP